MSNPDLEGNLRRYLLFSGCVFTPLFVPVIVLFWQENGLDLTDVFLLQALFSVAVVLLEVPTGMVADRLGKRTSLLAASAVLAAGFALYGFGHGFAWFLGVEVALALGAALYSGADSGLLYDTLAALDRKEEYTRWAGRGRAVQMFSFAASNIVGGLLATWSLRATLLCSTLGPIAAFGVAWRMTEVQRPAPTSSLREGLAAYGSLIAAALRFVRRHQLVRWNIALLAVLTGSSTWLLWLYQPWMEHVGLPLWAFGLAFALFNVWAAGSGALADRLQRTLGQRGALVALAALQVAPLVLMPMWAVPASVLWILGHQTVRGAARPILTERILAHTWEDKRATVLSLSSLAGRLFYALTAPLLGVAVGALALSDALRLQGVVLVVLLGVLAIARVRIPAKYDRVKPVERT